MRNPNGYGSVVKLSGNRRKPFMARVTTGYKDNGQPIYKALDYFTRREDALICLANFNEQQFNVDLRNITFAQLYKKLEELKFPKYSDSLRATLSAAKNHCQRLSNLRYRAIKPYQMQMCIDNCGKSYATQANIRNLFCHLDKLAFEMDIIAKRYSETLTVPTAAPKKKVPFTDEEVQKLWAHIEQPGAEQALFMLYTGCRVSEMLLMRCDDIRYGYMVGGVKTAAGKNRAIPIHHELKPIVERHQNGAEWLFEIDVKSGRDILLARKKAFSRLWEPLMASLGMSHTTHECRHTFRSKLDSAGANKVAIDLIMGHKSADVGERVYTHKTMQELQEAVEKLSYGLPVSNA